MTRWQAHPWTSTGGQRRVKRAAVLAVYHYAGKHWRAWSGLRFASVMAVWGIE